MSILGEWPVRYHVYAGFNSPLIMAGDRVVIKEEINDEGEKEYYFEAYRAANRLLRVQVSYDERTDSIGGRLSSSPYYEVYAYTKSFSDSYIFGFARNRTSADDSGGQWDGNRPPVSSGD